MSMTRNYDYETPQASKRHQPTNHAKTKGEQTPATTMPANKR